MTIFEKAVQLSLETWIDSLPDLNDVPTYKFSKRHSKKMERLINKMRGDRYHLLTSTEERVLNAVIMLILVFVMIMTFQI